MKPLIGCRLLFNLRVTPHTHMHTHPHAHTHAHHLCWPVKVLREMECGFYNSAGGSKVNRFVTVSKDLSVKAKMPRRVHTHTHSRTHIPYLNAYSVVSKYSLLCRFSTNFNCLWENQIIYGGFFFFLMPSGHTCWSGSDATHMTLELVQPGFGLASRLCVFGPNGTPQSQSYPL